MLTEAEAREKNCPVVRLQVAFRPDGGGVLILPTGGTVEFADDGFLIEV